MADVQQWKAPGISDRTMVTGRTGTGKTRFGVWILSISPFDSIPYVVLDYKGEELFGRTDRIKEIGLNEVPRHRGVYIIHPEPDDADAVENWLRKIKANGNVGTFIDEGYGINKNSKALQAVLTQGRSLHLPCIFLSQRPSWISPFVASEADYFAVFPLNKPEDRERVQSMIPEDVCDITTRLDDYHSHWFDVKRNWHCVMAPVPSDDDILNFLDNRLTPKKLHR